MKKSKAQKDILTISISAFIVVAAWVGFNIYHSHADTTIEAEIQAQIIPIDPSFKTQVIQELKNRKKVVPALQFSSSSSSAQPQPTSPQAATTSANLNTQPAPTGSFTIFGQ